MTRINKDFKVTKAVPLNSHYNICNNDYKQYVLSDNHFYLYRLDILCGFSDSDHPEDTFWQSDRSNFNPIHFWATSDNENDAFFELVQRVVYFFNVILDNSNINLKNIEKFIDKPNKYPELCQAWIESIIGKNLLINGNLIEACQQIEEYQYKFRKMCELVDGICIFAGFEVLYNDFLEIKNINNF